MCTARRIWDETGEVPEEDALKAYLKGKNVYRGLHSQSSQRILEEFAESFESWYGHRRNGNTHHNPPGYRKNYHHDGSESHPDGGQLTLHTSVEDAKKVEAKVTPSLSADKDRDRSTGWLAQPVVNLFRQQKTSISALPSGQWSGDARGERDHRCGQGTFTQHVNTYKP